MQTWTEKESLGNGITCYRGVIKKELDLINRLENTIGPVAPYGELSSDGKRYHWMPAYVGYQQLMPEYRDCVDFKFKKSDMERDTSEESLKLFNHELKTNGTSRSLALRITTGKSFGFTIDMLVHYFCVYRFCWLFG